MEGTPMAVSARFAAARGGEWPTRPFCVGMLGFVRVGTSCQDLGDVAAKRKRMIELLTVATETKIQVNGEKAHHQQPPQDSSEWSVTLHRLWNKEEGCQGDNEWPKVQPHCCR